MNSQHSKAPSECANGKQGSNIQFARAELFALVHLLARQAAREYVEAQIEEQSR